VPDQESVYPSAEPGLLRSAISNEIVRLHARYYGRGPTRARTFLGREFALCVLEDVFTPAEHTLVRAGKADAVYSTRMAFQDALHDEFVATVERVTGRTVRAFMSQVHLEPDVAAELFLFEPLDGPGLDGNEEVTPRDG
jgi:uncharacterized protein YbcI